MSGRDLSHGRCVQRVCCSSWSCTPHVADCPSIDDWARPPALAIILDHRVVAGSSGYALTQDAARALLDFPERP